MNRSMVTLAGVLGVCGFLVVTSFTTAHAHRRSAEPRKAELVDLIDARRRQVGELDTALNELRSDLAAAQEEAARRNEVDQELARLAASLAAHAGTLAVTGPGIVVELDNSDRTPADPAEAGAYRIHDSDLQLVVNALFLSGAEAVAVNDSRVVATTAIRAAGDTIVVNFRPVSPPYAVAAIGADRELFERTEIARRFQRWVGLFGLGFSIKEADDLTAPAHTGRVRIATAVPVDEGT